MPILDLPLNELKAYGGINPRPEDFDIYWERGLVEMGSVDPDVELIEAGFKAPGGGLL